ncbi:AraC family transcriptional regulator [Sulfidibacter corallicola]|uniref:AraC family transcriptional regulator n=1 Tax=Sulfidibacter corallicola TaxID=2818388 RepID=A0A8A4THI7_SULCO|nr:helix-turn-helix domain-containing protein [Sulfidibacter corallicola]QTD49010.1 AraC family transcriptional regulator [Sulfidibacter corallicola]
MTPRRIEGYYPRLAAAVNFMEAHLFQAVSLEDIAAQAAFSPYHFHRMFHAVLGETVAEYLRKRRLTEACRSLQESSRAILDIALACQFESQAAFTRAFKRMFGMPPGAFRKERPRPTYTEKVPASEELMQSLQTSATLIPDLRRRESIEVVGLAGSYTDADFAAIETQWGRFAKAIDGYSAENEIGASFGLCLGEHPEVSPRRSGDFIYLTAVPFREELGVPPSMVRYLLPGGSYRVFTHRGALDQFPHTLNYIWGTWLPKGGLGTLIGADFERYDHRFDPVGRRGEIEVWLPDADPSNSNHEVAR